MKKIKTVMSYAFGDKYIEIKFIEQLPKELAEKFNLEIGHYCGYVIVNRNNGDGTFNDYFESDLNVHGGVTYYAKDNDFITIGFDCSHYGDNLTNCNLDYVRSECEKLAKQL